MRILFVASSNAASGISPIVLNQGESLIKTGIRVDYFPLKGKGIFGYLSNIPALRKHMKNNDYNCIHAHYALIGIVSSLAGAKPLVVSLMGSDVYEFRWLKLLSRVFSRLLWNITIVKSKAMRDHTRLTTAEIIPNGVDLDKFKIYSDEEIKKVIPPLSMKKTVIFLGNPNKREKNIELALRALKFVDYPNHEFLPLYGIPNEQIPFYMNAASVMVLTSQWEGSPNVVKEAMACNLPIVSVDVGDVREVIGSTEGCYLTSHDPVDIANKITTALEFGKRTDGRKRVSHLNSTIIAERLSRLYRNLE